MIVEIPEAADFARASVNLLNLAWEIAVQSVRAWDHSEVMNPLVTPDFKLRLEDGTLEHHDGYKDPWTDEERAAAETEFWRRSQPSLGNGLSLVQQSIELALKGRIAEVSAFLLVARDARDYPKGSTTADVPFSAFRTLDASDLMRVHDTVCDRRLGDAFATFWDGVRRERNAIIHSVSPSAPIVRPERLMALAFVVSRALHPGKTWFHHRLHYAMTDESQVAFRSDPKETFARILDEFKDAIGSLDSTFLKQQIGLDPKSRTYSCVACRADADDEC